MLRPASEANQLMKAMEHARQFCIAEHARRYLEEIQNKIFESATLVKGSLLYRIDPKIAVGDRDPFAEPINNMMPIIHFICAELKAAGYDTSVIGNGITISWAMSREPLCSDSPVYNPSDPANAQELKDAAMTPYKGLR